MPHDRAIAASQMREIDDLARFAEVGRGDRGERPPEETDDLASLAEAREHRTSSSKHSASPPPKPPPSGQREPPSLGRAPEDTVNEALGRVSESPSTDWGGSMPSEVLE